MKAASESAQIMPTSHKALTPQNGAARKPITSEIGAAHATVTSGALVPRHLKRPQTTASECPRNRAKSTTASECPRNRAKSSQLQRLVRQRTTHPACDTRDGASDDLGGEAPSRE